MLKPLVMDTNLSLKPSNQADNFKNKIMPYVKRWYLFLIALFISLALVWLYLQYATPYYKVTSTLQVPDDKKGDGSILKATAFSDLNMFQESKTVGNEMEILRSRDIIYKVLKKLNLGTSFYAEKDFKTIELYGNDLPFSVTIENVEKAAYLKKLQLQSLSDSTFLLTDEDQTWKYRYGQMIRHTDYAFMVSKGPAFALKYPKPIFIRFNDLNKMASSYSLTKLQVNPVVKESNTIVLSLIDAIPARGIDILASLINFYNMESVEKKNLMAVSTIQLIDKRLKLLEDDLSYAEGDIETYKQQNGTVDASAGAQINLTKSAENNQLIEESNVQIGIVNSLLSYLDDTKNQFKAAPSTMGLKDPTLNSLIGRFNDLQLERNRMLNSAQLSNPLVQNLSDQIASIRVNIMENLGNIKKGLEIERNQLKINSGQYNSKIHSAPAVERGLLQRGREQSVKTTLYQYLLQKREETAISLSAAIPTALLVDKPAYNPVPEYPKQALLYLCGSIFGLLLPALTIYIIEKLNFKVMDASSLSSITDVRVLGELSHYEMESPIAIQKGSTTIISELFRYIRAHLGVLNQNLPNKVMLITSCRGGEGKTFFSINLGLTLALLNKKVLIMEFDLRKPDLLRMLDIPQTKGITDYLEGYNDIICDCVQPYPKAANLYVLGCGSIPQHPAELLLDPRMDGIFEKLRDCFDYILIDTSPVGAVADAFSLAKYADLSIYLVRYNYTSKEQLDILKDINDNKRLNNLMVVFNDAKKANRTYAYGGYGYTMAYGS